jgi:hypothetical protein
VSFLGSNSKSFSKRPIERRPRQHKDTLSSPGEVAFEARSLTMSHSSHDDYSKPWGLAHLYRRDVEQADIAPLMASLIGIDWPVNSVGVLPDVDTTRPGYLNIDDSSKARAALINAKVIFEQYRVKHGVFPLIVSKRNSDG